MYKIALALTSICVFLLDILLNILVIFSELRSENLINIIFHYCHDYHESNGEIDS